ncbi:unnamed protein product [Boreogadus saida]
MTSPKPSLTLLIEEFDLSPSLAPAGQGHVTCCRTRRLTRAETDGPGDASVSEGAGGGVDDRDEVSEEKHSPQKAVAASGHVHHPDSSS